MVDTDDEGTTVEEVAQQVWDVIMDCNKAGKDELKSKIKDKRKKQKKKEEKQRRKERKQSKNFKNKGKGKGKDTDSSSNSAPSSESSSSSGSWTSSEESGHKRKKTTQWQPRNRGAEVEFKNIVGQKHFRS